MRRLFILGLAALACARTTAPADGSVAPAPSTALRHVVLGLCEDYPEETRSQAEVRRDLALVSNAGLEALRVSVGWDDLEPEPGRYDFAFLDDLVRAAEEQHVRLVPYVAYTPA